MVDKVTKKLNLDLTGIPTTKRTEVLNDVGEVLIDQILRKVASGTSPVNGRKFKILNKEYAETEKGGNRNPNLELQGDMLRSLEFRIENDGIEIGIFNPSQVPKADGHNNFSGESTLPTRRFIPLEDQSFTNEIMGMVRSVIDSAKEEPTTPTISPTKVKEGIGIKVEDILTIDAFNRFFGDGEG